MTGVSDISTSTGERKSGFFYGYVVLGLGFVVLLIMWGLVYSYGVFFKPVSEEFGWTRAVTSGAFSLYTGLHGALYIVTGKLNDRFGPRVVTTACGLFLGIGFLLMTWINAVWQLYLFYGVLMGIGLSGGMVPMASTVARWFVKRRGLATGIVVSGIGMGATIMPPVARWFISSYGWRLSFLSIGIAATVILVLLAQFLKRDPSQVGQLPYGVTGSTQQKVADWEPEGFSAKEAVHTRQFWMFCGIFFCFAGLSNPVLVHIVPHATDLGISPIVAAGIMAVIGALSVVGRLVMGGVADRIGRRTTLSIVCALIMAAFIWLIPARELWSLFFFAVLFGFSWGGGNVLISPVTAELFGLKSHGAILGIVAAVATLGGAFGPLLAGYVYDKAGSYLISFEVFAAVSATGLVLSLLLKSAPAKSESQTPPPTPSPSTEKGK